MAQDFGNGVSRTLSALQRQFQLVIWQASKPPLDSELNLMSQVDMERLANVVRAEMHSGFLLDPVDALSDYGFSSNWSNFFKLGNPVAAGVSPPVWANVNGWLIPVTGTAVADGDSSNRVDLYGPPSTDNRIDFVFLEVWQAQVAPNPSTENKPSAAFIWKYGNTKFGGTNMADQMEDPTIGFETTERLQLQYRIRTFGSGVGLGESLDLATYPNGLDDPNVLGQGGATTPVAYGWQNMGEELGDPGLWRAGNGDATNDLKTVNGYTYAIPICAVFRRNSSTYVSVISAGNAQQNGGLNRNPTTATLTDPSEATRIFTGVTLTNALVAPTPLNPEFGTGAVQVDGMANSGFDNSDINWNSTFLMLGDEVFSISGVDTSTVPATITIRDGTAVPAQGGGRGRAGTQAVSHNAGTPIAFYNFRPDGFFSDEIAPQDILDQRRGVTLGEWDYDQILTHNLGSLFGNELRSSYKQNPTTAGDTEGTVITEVDYLCGDAGVTVAQTEALDGPDGIRTVFSDAAVAQSDVTILLAPAVAGTPAANSNYVSGASWDVAADFVPDGFQTVDGWGNGTIIDLHIGGASGTGGARATVRGDSKNVRFLPPYEYWRDEGTWYRNNHNGRQTPITLRFMGQYATEPSGVDGTAGTQHPGPMFPLVENNFEYPFIFLGGHLSDDLVSSSATAWSEASAVGAYPEVRFAGLDFDASGTWWNGTDVTSSSLTGIAKLLFHGDYNLFDLLTDFGKDRSGSSSRVYLVLKGDTTTASNNGVFRVIGAGDGTAGYTHCNAMDASGLVVEFMGVASLPVSDFVNPTTGTPVTLTAEARSQYTSVKDGNGTSGTSSATIVITDIQGTRGGQANPWNGANATVYPIPTVVAGDCVANFVLQYGPSRGGTARVANRIDRFALVSPPASNALLRQSIRSLDEAANSTTVAPISGVGPRSSEIYYPLESLQTWNRLPGLGLHAPEAPNYGGDKFAVFTEQDRDCELFVDPGSKTVIFRPYRKIDMKLPGYNVNAEGAGVFIPANYPVPFSGINTDSANILLAGHHDGFAVPPEYMPRFGRQDIPVYVDIADPPGTGTFLSGINHLFVDGTDTAADNTAIIGGTDNAGAAAINNFFIQTGATSTLDYGAYGPILAGVGGGNAIQGRLLENGFGDVNVRSSDLEGHLEGIELPPFLGVARVYGVYDARDWQGDTSTAWEADRITPQVGASIPPNLIRTHADKQTLFIVQGGGEDMTLHADDHTYVIPSNVIDITKSSSFTAGETFSDLEYIVQCSVFYFARGFINKNNYVLVRGHNGAGVVGTSTADLTNVAMVAPAPATYPTQAYVAYDRTVYQGDPYMSRYGDTRVVSDYGMNYGVIQQSNAFLLEDPIQQYLEDAKVPEIPNPRALEVLASVDFWTTMGTGKMGGRVYAGTPSDVGYLNSSTRIPATGTADTNPWPTSPRVFTEGQPQTAPRAVAAITLTSHVQLAVGEGVEIKRAGITSIAGTTSLSVSFVAGGSWTLGADVTEDAISLAAAINGYGPTTEWAAEGGIGIIAIARGETVYIESVFPGSEGNDTRISLLPVGTNPFVTGMYLHKPPTPSFIGTAGDYGKYAFAASLPMSGGADLVVNGSWGNAHTPSKYTGLTERLPLGILLQDCDFIGEDPLRDGQSALFSKVSTNDLAMSREEPYVSGGSRGGVVPAARLGGTAVGSQMGMADGAILTWTPYSSVSGLGTKRFRLFRGASSYVLSPHAGEGGGPVDWALGGLDESETPMLKGAVLLGRALLVRNYKEEVFAAADTVSYGDEIQMVVLTRGILGEGQACEKGYLLDGAISPSGYGKGYSASDRYRLEGKPFITTHTKQSLDPDVEIVAYPSIDPTEDPCP